MNGFAIIPVKLAQSAAVSAQAKAVYVALMSHSGAESVELAQLAKEVGTTPQATARALDTLHQRGWGRALDGLAPRVVDTCAAGLSSPDCIPEREGAA